MYESDMMYQIRSDYETTKAIISMAYDLSQPFTDEQKAKFIEGPIPEGTLNALIMWQSKYMVCSVAYVAGVIHGREVNLSIIRTCFNGKKAHHIKKQWKNHSPNQLLTLVYNFGMFEPLRKIVYK
jgi:hypothetical protein